MKHFSSTLKFLTLTFLVLSARAQQPSTSSPLLSEALRTAYFPDIVCVGCVIPEWDGNYFVHHDPNRGRAVVTGWTPTGQNFITARISLPDHTQVSVGTASVTKDRGILAVGGFAATDGNPELFVARTDPAGRTTQWFATPGFSSSRACEAPDGTVWLLGYEHASDSSPDAIRHAIRHYSFDRGLLGALVPLNSISSDSTELMLDLTSHVRNRLHCGADRLSAFLARTGQYIEIDFATGKESTWQVDVPSTLEQGRFEGLAVTSDHRVFVVFTRRDTPHRLYQLRLPSNSSAAELLPIDNGSANEPRFSYIFGADGNNLVVHPIGAGTPAVSWLSVSNSASPSATD